MWAEWDWAGPTSELSSTLFFLFFSFHGSHVGFAFISFFFFPMCNRYLCLFFWSGWRAKRTKLRKENDRRWESERETVRDERGRREQGRLITTEGKKKKITTRVGEGGEGEGLERTWSSIYTYMRIHTYILTYYTQHKHVTNWPLYFYLIHLHLSSTPASLFWLYPSRRVYCTTFPINPVSLQSTTWMMT